MTCQKWLILATPRVLDSCQSKQTEACKNMDIGNALPTHIFFIPAYLILNFHTYQIWVCVCNCPKEANKRISVYTPLKLEKHSVICFHSVLLDKNMYFSNSRTGRNGWVTWCQCVSSLLQDFLRVIYLGSCEGPNCSVAGSQNN